MLAKPRTSQALGPQAPAMSVASQAFSFLWMSFSRPLAASLVCLFFVGAGTLVFWKISDREPVALLEKAATRPGKAQPNKMKQAVSAVTSVWVKRHDQDVLAGSQNRKRARSVDSLHEAAMLREKTERKTMKQAVSAVTPVLPKSPYQSVAIGSQNPKMAALLKEFNNEELQSPEADRLFSIKEIKVSKAILRIVSLDTVAMSYELTQFSHVTVSVFQEQKPLLVLVDEDKKQGSYAATWNGKDKDGRSVATGIYHMTLKTVFFEETKKILVIHEEDEEKLQ